MRALVAIVALAVSCAGPSSLASPTPAVAPTPTAASAPGASPSASPASDPVRARAAGPLRPEDILVANSFDVARLWVVDTTWARPPRVVVSWRFEGAHGPRSSWSRDGRVVVMSAPGPSGRAAIYVVRTESGEVRALASDTAADLRYPVISPDGARVAYTRMPATGGNDGLWTVAAAGGAPERIVAPAPADTRALGWSADGAWLAVTHENDPHLPSPVDVFVVSSAGGTLRRTGGFAWPEPSAIAWHPREPLVLLAASGSPTTIPDSSLHAYDAGSGSSTLLSRVERRSVLYVSWHPSEERFLFAERAVAESGRILSRDLAGRMTVLGEAAQFLVGLRWSPDGRRVIAQVGGDDSVQSLAELGTSRGTTICLRGDDPTSCA